MFDEGWGGSAVGAGIGRGALRNWGNGWRKFPSLVRGRRVVDGAGRGGRGLR